MKSELFSASHLEVETNERLAVQGKKTLKASLSEGESIYALKGSMVAYQGEVDFHHKSAGGVGKWLKQNLTGEDTPLMTVTSRVPDSDVFFAKSAKDVFIVELEAESISVNGQSILAFEQSLTHEVHRVKGAGMLSGGMFNTLLSGSGKVALTSDGQPFILDCSTPTAVDINAVVAWSGDLTPVLKSSMNVKSFIRGGTGEAFQYVFHGRGFVVVQPSENPNGVPEHSHPS